MSQENAEVVRRVLVEVPVDGIDVAPLFRDDATWTAMTAEIEGSTTPTVPLFGSPKASL